MAFTDALGSPNLEDGFRVIGVNPGPAATECTIKVLRSAATRLLGIEARLGELLAGYPSGRAATVAEVADLFVFLALRRSSNPSGTIFTVDGGITLRRSLE